MKQSTNLELNEPDLGWNECEELAHSQQQQPQAPKIIENDAKSLSRPLAWLL